MQSFEHVFTDNGLIFCNWFVKIVNILLFFWCFSSHARRRDVENRKRNLANKVDEIRKKMKNSEKREDSYATTIVGLVLCVVVAGFAFFYCRCNQ